MIRRIRQLMATPFARPPGRRKLWVRFDPELRAAIIYAVVLLIAWALRREEYGLTVAAVIGYMIAGLLLFATPAAQVARALAGETDLGTAEALVLTPGDHAPLAWGRFLHAAWPWLRMLLWMLPLYAVLARALAGLGGFGDDWVFPVALAALGPKLSITAVMADVTRSEAVALELGILLVIFRFLKDALDVLTLSAIAYRVSAMARSGKRATAVAGAVGPVLLLTVFLADLWLALVVQLWARLSDLSWSEAQNLSGAVYALAALAMLGFQCWAIWWCVSRVAKNFDCYLLGEKPERAP